MERPLNFNELAALIECNSHTKNKPGVDAHGEQMISLVKPLGLELTRFKREHIGDHLYFCSPKQQQGLHILLLGHLDTVFPENTFTDFRQDESYVYGPGVCDMKGGNWVALNALRNIKQQLGSICNIDWLLVSDEETGSDDSKLLTRSLASQYDACFVFEAAGKNHELVVARKGVATYQVEIIGKAAHAGNHYKDGIDANFALANMVLELTNLTDLKRGSTVNVGKVSGGIGANTISPCANLTVEARFTNLAEQQRLLEGIERICFAIEVSGVTVTVSGGLQRGVMAPSAQQLTLLELLESVLGEELPTEHRGGVSDANTVAATGTPTLDGFGPWGDGDHTEFERALKTSFELRIKQMTQILSAITTLETTDISKSTICIA